MTAEPHIIPLTRRNEPVHGFDPAESAPPHPELSPLPHTLALALILTPLVIIVLTAMTSDRAIVTATTSIGSLVMVAGAIVAAITALRVLARASTMTGGAIAKNLTISIVSSVLGAFAALSAIAMAVGSGRGRQLRVLGRPQYAPLATDTPWITEKDAIQDHDVELTDVADAWRTNGLTEHASVAAFAELSIDLVSLGAPPALIAAAHEDALDEMRHTTLCFELARSLDGKTLGPRDFASAARMRPRMGPRALRLSSLAVSSLFDGALYEGLSARVVASLAKSDVDARVRPILQAIAKDEARHAVHGMDVVRWCLAEGGPTVALALQQAVDRARVQPAHGLGGALLADGRFERFGLPGKAREDAHWAIVRSRVCTRVDALISEVLGRASA